MRTLTLLSAAALLWVAPSVAQAQVYGDPNSLVMSWYQTYLGRSADLGAAGWVNMLNQGTPPDQVLDGILGSDEFYQKAGSTPTGFITTLYTDILGRAPTPAELNYWVGRMYVDTRQTIAYDILTQNPGVWVGSGPAPAPVVGVGPGIEWERHQGWERDRHGDWDRRHDIHEYRPPDNRGHHEEHHDVHQGHRR